MIVGKDFTIDEIKQRMQAGDPLRWVPCSISGIKHKVLQSDLFLGRDLLSGSSFFEIFDAVERGELRTLEEPGMNITHYELVAELY